MVLLLLSMLGQIFHNRPFLCKVLFLTNYTILILITVQRRWAYNILNIAELQGLVFRAFGEA